MDSSSLVDIPETKPAIEQIRGVRFSKMSPKRRHALAQTRIGAQLAVWAGDRGEVGNEWRCYFFTTNEPATSLVPDVAYFSFERLPLVLGEAREQPTLAPDIAVEIWSPDDSRRRLREKIELYFAFGARAVVVVDPAAGTFVVFESPEQATAFARGTLPTFAAFPDLRVDLDDLFRDLA